MTQRIDEAVETMDKKLEELFSLAVYSILAYLERNITEEERTALLALWNDEAKNEYKLLLSKVQSQEREEFLKIVGEDELLPARCHDREVETINFARNELRAELRLALKEKYGKTM